jgi:ABC-type glycerol-3-phosphate transport system permease component
MKIVKLVLLWSFLLLMVVITLFPVVVAVFGSFKSAQDIQLGQVFISGGWEWSNYERAWKEANFAQYTWNSLFLSIVSTIGTVLVAAMAAYLVDRREFAGKKLFVALQASTLFVSIGAIVLRPQFELMVDLGMNKSLWGVILILISQHASTFFILLGFFKAIPRDLDEAAMIDGSNFISIFWRIILPLLTPGIAVTSLLAFRHAWNEYILPLVFTMTQPALQPLTVGLVNLRYGQTDAEQVNLMLAGACISIIPILIVYLLANKYFIQVTAGSVKG